MSPGRSKKRWLLFYSVSLCALLAAHRVAYAEEPPPSDTELGRDDPYCEWVREAAKSSAAVLLGPRIAAQGTKFPAGGDVLLTGVSNTAALYQVRAFASWSPTSAYNGVLTLRLGELECGRHRYARDVTAAIRVALNQGRREALAREIAFLRANEPSVVAIERDAEARRAAGVATVAEAEEIRERASEVRAARLSAAETVAELEATDLPEPARPIAPEAEQYARATMEYERVNSRIRQVAPWSVSISGGIASSIGAAGAGASVDWFGTVEVGYNLGGIVQERAERALLAARERELRGSPEELLYAARAVDGSLRKSIAVLEAQIAMLAEADHSLSQQLDALDKAEVPNRIQTVSVLRLRSVMVRAQLVYVRVLVERRRPWEISSEP